MLPGSLSLVFSIKSSRLRMSVSICPAVLGGDWLVVSEVAVVAGAVGDPVADKLVSVLDDAGLSVAFGVGGIRTLWWCCPASGPLGVVTPIQVVELAAVVVGLF